MGASSRLFAFVSACAARAYFFPVIRVKDAQPVVERRPRPGPAWVEDPGAAPRRASCTVMMRLHLTTNWTYSTPLQEKSAPSPLRSSESQIDLRRRQLLNHTNYQIPIKLTPSLKSASARNGPYLENNLSMLMRPASSLSWSVRCEFRFGPGEVVSGTKFI